MALVTSMKPQHLTTITSFLNREWPSEIIGFVHCSLGDSGVNFPENSESLAELISWPGISPTDMHHNLCNLADQLRGASDDIRELIDRFDGEHPEFLEGPIAKPGRVGFALPKSDPTTTSNRSDV